jgi:hypothetical protein
VHDVLTDRFLVTDAICPLSVDMTRDQRVAVGWRIVTGEFAKEWRAVWEDFRDWWRSTFALRDAADNLR